MLILTEKDITALFTMTDAIDAVKEAYRLQSTGNTEAPVRQKLSGAAPQDAFLFMPASVDGGNKAGIKILSVFPGNRALNRPVIAASMFLLDCHTGEALCIMDGAALTQLRTGAATGAATDLLARPDAKIAALFGTGGQSERQLEAMLNVRDLDEVRIYSRNAAQRQAFTAAMDQRFSGAFRARIIEAHSPEAALVGADIVTCATSSTTPVFDGSLIEPGTHVNGIGSFTLGMQELDETLISTCDRLYIDAWDACEEEAGDIMIPLNAGRIGRSRITGELGELLLGSVPGRQSPQEITVFKSVGIAPQDIVTADRIFQKALALGVGQNISL